MAMVLEKEILPFMQWLQGGLVYALLVVLLAVLGAFFIGFLVSALRHGPVTAVHNVSSSFGRGLRELSQVSLRRVYAMARLAFQESIRRWVLAVFAVFLIFLAFGALFLNRGQSDHPARLYLSFVITATNYLVMLLAIFLSTFSLPSDIKNRTIFTVVTKPVRAWEILLGRVFGFAAIGTIVLALVAVSSFIFVWRGLDHSHGVITAELIQPEDTLENVEVARRGQTTFDGYHRHDVLVYKDGTWVVEENLDHTHSLRSPAPADLSETTELALGRPQGMLQARIPVRGKLRFLDRSGAPTDKGINVGNEWTYRSYIEGRSLSRAIWTFDGVRDTVFGDYLPLELNIRVFRTYKGIIDQGIAGQIELVRPDPDRPLRSEPINFIAKDGMVDQHFIPRKLTVLDPQGNQQTIDLYDDLVYDGKLEVWLSCLEDQQYFGVAQADAYLRKADGRFWWNFSKGYIGLWFQMFLITCYGVMFSTFLNGPVAMLASLSGMIVGFFPWFIRGVAKGTIEGDVEGAILGGGPLESLYRIPKQVNVILPLQDSLATRAMQTVDAVIMKLMEGTTYLFPDFGKFSTTDFVVYGFDIPGNLVLQHAVLVVAYFVLTIAVGYYCLKSRELAA